MMFDAHCHLEKGENCIASINSLKQQALSAGVKRIVLLNLPELAFSNHEVIEAASNDKQFFLPFPGLNPRDEGILKKLEHLRRLGAFGLKLHPRMHGYNVEESECIEIVWAAGDLGMPVLIDCFPDGENLRLGNTIDAFARLASRTRDTRIAIGHAGGHHVLDAMMAAKRFENIYLDFSFSLLYYRQNKRVMDDMVYAIGNAALKSMWGTDYPDRPYIDTVKMSLEVAERYDLSEETRKNFFELNIEAFLRGSR